MTSQLASILRQLDRRSFLQVTSAFALAGLAARGAEGLRERLDLPMILSVWVWLRGIQAKMGLCFGRDLRPIR